MSGRLEGRLGLLGAFSRLLLQAENDVFPKKKRDEDDRLRFLFLLRFSLKELAKSLPTLLQE